MKATTLGRPFPSSRTDQSTVLSISLSLLFASFFFSCLTLRLRSVADKLDNRHTCARETTITLYFIIYRPMVSVGYNNVPQPHQRQHNSQMLLTDVMLDLNHRDGVSDKVIKNIGVLTWLF